MSQSHNSVRRIVARIKLHATAQGGRSTPASDRYTPHLKIDKVDGYGRFVLSDGFLFYPGTTRVVELFIVGSPDFMGRMNPGRVALIYEGEQQVGEALVEAFLS